VVTAAWRVQVNLAVRAALVLLLVGFARSLLGVCPPLLSPASAWLSILCAQHCKGSVSEHCCRT